MSSCGILTKNFIKMNTLDYIEKIDDILASYEDWMHGQDGEDCTNARFYLREVKKQLLINVVSQQRELVCPAGYYPNHASTGLECVHCGRGKYAH